MNKRTPLFFAAVLVLMAKLSAQTLPSGFSSTNIASGWSEPVGAAFTNDGQQLFVWEKNGRVYVCNRDGSGNYIKQTTPVLDISEEVGNWRDHGLLGFALDPAFATNGYIYLLYVVDRHYLMHYGTPSYNSATNEYFNATIGRVTKYQTITSGPNLVANPASRTILLGESASTGMPILHESHGIGSLAFGADGMLLVSCGDGASYLTTDGGSISHTYYAQALTDGIIRPEENVGAFRSQLLNSHNGKLLRIDPATGNGLASNPFYDAAAPRSAQSRVWAFGFRNPFRFAFKPGTGSTNPSTGDIGEIYVGDVGWNTWEELNIITGPGMNCGWPLYEGLTQLNSYYSLSKENPDEPNPLHGGACTQQYLYFKNLVKQATADNDKTVYNPCDNAEPIGTGNRYFHRRPALDWRHGQDVARVGIFIGNNAAEATIGTPASGVTGTPFRGNCSVAGTWYTGTSFPSAYQDCFFQADLGGTWLKCIKTDFTDKVTSVTNFASGFAAIVCISQNPLDGSLVCVDIGTGTVKRISYGGNQPPVVKLSSDKIYGPSTLQVSFTGSDSFDPDGSITSYSWDFDDGGTSSMADPVHSFSGTPGVPQKFTVSLTVTDNNGGTATGNLIISVNNTPPLVTITSPIKNSKYTIGPDTLYACTADISDAEHSAAQMTYAWQTFLRHNNHEHPESIDPNETTTTQISRIGCNGDDYYWHIELTVTDAAGLSTIDSSNIYPDCSLQSPLPVFLRSFSVTPGAAGHFVRWVVEFEENIAYYEVQRSSNGTSFAGINQQPARNNAGRTEYNFASVDVPAGTSYYRLKIVDHDGSARYSMILRMESAGNGPSLLVAPNPVRDQLSVVYGAPVEGLVQIEIYDASGRTVATSRQRVQRGQNILYMAAGTWNRADGLYVLVLRQDHQVSRTRFVLNQ